jgi:very-short-patch-repair endonuclease
MKLTEIINEEQFFELSKILLAAMMSKGMWAPAKWACNKELKITVQEMNLPWYFNFEEKRDALRFGAYTRPKCSCGAFSRMYHGTQIKTYGLFSRTCNNVKCAMNDPQTKRKIQATTAERFENGLKNPAIREKTRRSMAAKSNEERAATYKRQMQTNIDRYGALFGGVRQSSEQYIITMNKLELAIQKKHGVKSMLSLKHVQAHTKELAVQKYNAEVFPKTIQVLKERNLTVHGDWVGWTSSYSADCSVCNNTVVLKRLTADSLCPICYTRSKPQLFISQLLTLLGVKFQENTRKILPNRELDFYIPSLKLGIEVNGLYWHRDDSASLPLIEKTKLAEKCGLQLLHLWEHEILERPTAVKNMLLAKLKMAKRVFARCTSFAHISEQEANLFLEQHHVLGAVKCKYALGLMYRNELVAVATFNKSRFAGGKTELLRFASAGVVVGALSKIIKSLGPCKIITYADRRFSSMNTAYQKIGFTFTGITKPEHFYHRNLKIITRYDLKKRKLPQKLVSSYDSTKTEYENMLAAGYDRCTNCGTLKLEYEQR